MEVLDGVRAIDRRAGVTVKVVFEETLPTNALMVVLPTAAAVATARVPVLEMVAIPVCAELQFTDWVTSYV